MATHFQPELSQRIRLLPKQENAVKESDRRAPEKLALWFERLVSLFIRKSAAKILLWTGMAVATSCIAVSCAVNNSVLGAHCTGASCTYFDNGQSLPGICGSKKGDDKQCYCFDKKDKKRGQEQIGCSAK